jgi:hypothetical protein
MRTPQKTLEPIATIGVDLGKNTFHLVGLDKRGAIVLQQKVSRGQLERRLANPGPQGSRTTIAMPRRSRRSINTATAPPENLTQTQPATCSAAC